MRLLYAAVLMASIALAGVPGAAATGHKLKGSEFAGVAKVKLAEARATALRARPGAITDEELEKEVGGSGLRYSFDIAASGQTYEVGVDAKTGIVLEHKAEGKHPD